MLGPGYLYVLQGAADRDLVKIGMTRSVPIERAKQVSAEYGLGPYEVVRSWRVPNPEWFEAMIHRRFHSERLSLAKELFRVDVREVDDAVAELLRDVPKSSPPTIYDGLVAKSVGYRVEHHRRPWRASAELVRRRLRL